MKGLQLILGVFQKEDGVEGFALWQILGPIFIIATFGLADNSPILLSAGFIGLYLAARSQKIQALVVVAVLSLIQQIILKDHHLWFLGLELSLGCSLFITAIGFESGAQFVDSLVSRADASAASVQNLEEELAKEREDAQNQQVAAQDRVAQLQKECEDLQTEQSTLFILNEVLRKTAVRHTEEKAFLEEKLLNQQRHIATLQGDLIHVEKEMERLSHPESLAEQNRGLITELNTARYQKEQMQLINETLVRLHAKETLKVKAATGLQQMFDQVLQEKDALRKSLEKMQLAQNDRRLLEQRLQATQEELGKVKLQASSGVLVAQEEIKTLRVDAEKAHLFDQLRNQFDEKNKVLHETRAALFRADAELQTLRLEKEQLLLQVGVIPSEVTRDLERLEAETAYLKEDNQCLEEIISVLSLKKK